MINDKNIETAESVASILRAHSAIVEKFSRRQGVMAGVMIACAVHGVALFMSFVWQWVFSDLFRWDMAYASIVELVLAGAGIYAPCWRVSPPMGTVTYLEDLLKSARALMEHEKSRDADRHK